MMDGHLTDRIPDVAHGAGTWTAEEQGHLATCDDCRRELALVGDVLARAAGASGLDVERIASVVLARLRDEVRVVPIASRRGTVMRWVVGLAAAAAVVVTAIVWRPGSAPEAVAVGTARAPTMLPELDALLDSELEVVLASIAPDEVEPLGSVPRLGDLTDTELEQLLQSVEES